jgi:hypothetical protein
VEVAAATGRRAGSRHATCGCHCLTLPSFRYSLAAQHIVWNASKPARREVDRTAPPPFT